jgi:hypothetical protein
MSDFQELDAVVTGCAYQFATAALGLLEQGRGAAAISTEMLCTLDNFIKVVLFNDRIFITGVASLENSQFGVVEARFGGSAESRDLFKWADIGVQLPEFKGNTQAVYANVASTYAPLDPAQSAHVVLKCALPKKRATVYQEMISYDIYLIEYAIEQCGAQMFKPVFPGEHLYLGLRSKRLPRPRATHTMADIAGIRLRELIATELGKLNKLTGFGARYLPPLPPIFVTQLLSNGASRRGLAKQILELRDSSALKTFRRKARECMQLAKSPDVAKRKQAAEALGKLESFSFKAGTSASTVVNGIKFVMQLAKGDFAGIALGQVETVIQYLSSYPLRGLEKFSSASGGSDRLDEYLMRNFGDKFNRNDLNSVSLLLGLPENISQWSAEEFDASISAGRVDGAAPPLSRPFSCTVEDPDVVTTAADEFEALWQKAKRVRVDPKTGEIVVDD